MEIWKTIPSDRSLEASSNGRIRVKPWLGKLPNGGYRRYGGTPTFRQWTNDCKRYIYCRRGYKTRRVAVLICQAFHGLAPKRKPYCLHRDENPRNNKPTNPKWGTQKENLTAPGFLRYCQSRTGINNPYVKGRT